MLLVVADSIGASSSSSSRTWSNGPPIALPGADPAGTIGADPAAPSEPVNEFPKLGPANVARRCARVLLGVEPCPKGESEGMCSEKGEGWVKWAWKTLAGTPGSAMVGKFGNLRAEEGESEAAVGVDPEWAVEGSTPERCEGSAIACRRETYSPHPSTSSGRNRPQTAQHRPALPSPETRMSNHSTTPEAEMQAWCLGCDRMEEWLSSSTDRTINEWIL